MKRIRRSTLLTLGLILAAGLVIAAASGAPPAKKCYNDAGEEIPCDSNYLQTQEAARATAREAGPAAPAVVASATASPTVTPTVTPTDTPAPSQTPLPTVMQAAAPPLATTRPAAPERPSATMVLIPVVMLGCAGVLVAVVLFLGFRWLSGRRNLPPGGSD